MNYKFVLEGGDEGVTLCAVEELALDHYRQNGYPEGMLEPHPPPPLGRLFGMNYKFVLEGVDEGVTLCAVEELALDHYRQNGYPEGLFNNYNLQNYS